MNEKELEELVDKKRKEVYDVLKNKKSEQYKNFLAICENKTKEEIIYDVNVYKEAFSVEDEIAEEVFSADTRNKIYDLVKDNTDNEKPSHKKNNKKGTIIAAILSSVLIAGGVISFNIAKKDKPNTTILENVSSIEQEKTLEESSDSIPSIQVPEREVLPENIVKQLEEILSENTESDQTNRVSNKRLNTEVIYATDENGNLLDLRDTLINGADLKDGIAINIISQNDSGSSTTTTSTDSNDSGSAGSTRTRGGSNANRNNDLVESALNNADEVNNTNLANPNNSDVYTYRLIGIVPFKYGSCLDMGQMSVIIEKYLLVLKVDDDKEEYASIILGLNNLIKKIPEDKKDSAVFTVMGYTDTTLFNGIPEVSERSEKFNTELSWKRAESVKAILTGKDFGISPEKVVTHGFGYSKNVNETTDLERFRKVEIVVSF